MGKDFIVTLVMFVRLLIGCMIISWNGVESARHKRRLYLYNDASLSWNGAARVCQDLGRHLLYLNELPVYNAFKHFTQNEYSVWNGRVTWVGFYAEQYSPLTYKWTGVCVAGRDTDVPIWKDGAPNIELNKLCCRILDAQLYHFSFESCSITSAFVCEEVLGECTWETKTGCRISVLGSTMLKLAELTLCQNACQSSADTGGATCWAVSFNPSDGYCTLYTGDNPYQFESVTCDATTVYYASFRRCFEMVLEQAPTSVDLFESYPEEWCLTQVSTNTNTTAITTSTSTTTSSVSLWDEQPSLTTTSTTTLTTTTNTDTGVKTTSTATITTETQSITSVFESNVTTTTSTMASQTTTNPASLTTDSSHVTSTSVFEYPTDTSTGSCYCPCLIPGSPDNRSLEVLLEELESLLKIEPKHLSKYLRQKISADDNRVSSRVIGFCLGTCVLACVAASIVLPDLFKLLRYCYFRCQNQDL